MAQLGGDTLIMDCTRCGARVTGPASHGSLIACGQCGRSWRVRWDRPTIDAKPGEFLQWNQSLHLDVVDEPK